MNIRPAQIEDIPAMVALGRKMHEESRYSRFNFDEAKATILIKYLIATGIALVAEEDYEIHGGILAKVDYFYFGYDLQAQDYALFIAPEHRGNLTAHSLIREYIKTAKTMGAKFITLGATTGYETDKVTRMFEQLGGRKIGSVYEF